MSSFERASFNKMEESSDENENLEIQANPIIKGSWVLCLSFRPKKRTLCSLTSSTPTGPKNGISLQKISKEEDLGSSVENAGIIT